MDLNDLPVIPLPGSEGWERAYEWGNVLDERFPEQDASDFAYACESNDYGPAESHQIVALEMLQQGERDDSDWIWKVTFDDGTSWLATGGCDYTGWDCRSWLDWKQAAAVAEP